MARKPKDYDITRKTPRLKLKPRVAAYFRRITDDTSLGYRRTLKGPGRWVVRQRQPGQDAYKESTLDAVADDEAAADGLNILSYDQALDRVAKTVAMIGSTMPTTHRAFDAWVDRKCAGKPHKRQKDYRSAAERHKKGIPDIPLDKVKPSIISTYHRSYLDGVDGMDDRALRSRKATADRALAEVMAAFNLAVHDNALPVDSRLWRVSKFGLKEAGNSRTIRLTIDEIRKLRDHIVCPDLDDLVVFAAETGARPGEIISARVRDFDADEQSIRLTGKTGQRDVMLSSTALGVIRRRIRGTNDPLKHIFTRPDGKPWGSAHHDLGYAFQRARDAAGINPEATLYCLRHSAISAMLERGASTIFVAQQTGTSAKMIESNYAKFIPDYGRSMIGGLV